MRSAIALLVLALAVAAHADNCPSGMSPVSKAVRGDLRAVGVKAFTTRAQAGVCDKLPAVILDFSAFNIDIQPICTTSNGETTLFRVVLDNPCNGGASDTVHMTIDTKPAKCHKVYDPRLARWGWHTPVPGNMRPLMCPTGFRHANSRDKALLTAFVNKQFTEVEMPHRLMGKKFVCTVGIQTLRWRYQNGCIQIWPKKGVSPYVMAQAKVTYSCYGSSKTFTLGIDGEGTFRTPCDWAVTFEPVVT